MSQHMDGTAQSDRALALDLGNRMEQCAASLQTQSQQLAKTTLVCCQSAGSAGTYIYVRQHVHSPGCATVMCIIIVCII